LNAGTDVTGQGTIKTAYVNTDDYSFEKEPEKKVVDGEEVKEEKKTSGGGGGGGWTSNTSREICCDNCW
jgi:hypothetical protein